jgi:hypothetical protein
MNRALETKRLIIDSLRETDKEAYFRNISHDRKVLIWGRSIDGTRFLMRRGYYISFIISNVLPQD